MTCSSNSGILSLELVLVIKTSVRTAASTSQLVYNHCRRDVEKQEEMELATMCQSSGVAYVIDSLRSEQHIYGLHLPL